MFNAEINKRMAFDNVSYMDARRTLLYQKNQSEIFPVKDSRNFLNLNPRIESSKTPSFADIIKRTFPTTLSADFCSKIKDLLLRISTPDAELILQKVSQLVNLHNNSQRKNELQTDSKKVNDSVS